METGERFIVWRVLVGPHGESVRIPLLAFDTKEAADEFSASEGAWLSSIPPAIVETVLGRLGIARVGMTVTGVKTPDGIRRIELAHAMPPGLNGQPKLR